ncbi:MAG: hypothetical protein IKM28_05230 [Lachnospiraceae bacterium]|nr:hypothetical protein [Lachnospiraceae bacterium]
MRRRKRRDVSEINLTPLLDILFSILFIVMMTGMQDKQEIKQDYQQQVSQMEQKMATLKEQAAGYEKQMSSHQIYQAEAVIVTIYNMVQEQKHYLIVKQGIEQKERERIQLGVERTENTRRRIEELVAELVESTDNQPVYLVFYCDKKKIYTAEYRAIVETFTRLEEANKEVFFKVMEITEIRE